MVELLTVSRFIEENCYLYIDDISGHGFIIDPGAEAERILEVIKSRSWQIEGILLTHGHFDHIGAVNELRNALKVDVYAHKTPENYLENKFYNLSDTTGCPVTVENVRDVGEGTVIRLASGSGISLQVIETPGHTGDSVVYYNPDAHLAFTGDTLFKGTYGRYDFPGGDYGKLIKSLKKILRLPDETVLYSGHSESTTVRDEKKYYGFS